MSYLTYNGKMVRAQGKYVLGAQVPGFRFPRNKKFIINRF